MSKRRNDLASFLRSRRERISPTDAGLPPGLRRRTPGLRREEVAQLAGVGVTWYTWLEQGRPINVSTQVLDAISRTLRLDQAEQQHLYRLAEVETLAPASGTICAIPPELQSILDELDPCPASVVNARFDLLAWNEPYQQLFPRLVNAVPEERNTIWQCFVCYAAKPPFLNREVELRLMVATLRSAFGRHLGEPAWTDFVRRLSARSSEFAQLWAQHDVADPAPRVKWFLHAGTEGEIRLVATSFAVNQLPDTRMMVYTPVDDEARGKLLRLGSVPAVGANR